MNFIPFHVCPKHKIKHWKRRDKAGNLIPYKVIAMDLDYTPPEIKDILEDPIVQRGIQQGVIDNEDITEMEEELENKREHRPPNQEVICWILVANHFNNSFKWFNIEDLRYCNFPSKE